MAGSLVPSFVRTLLIAGPLLLTACVFGCTSGQIADRPILRSLASLHTPQKTQSPRKKITPSKKNNIAPRARLGFAEVPPNKKRPESLILPIHFQDKNDALPKPKPLQKENNKTDKQDGTKNQNDKSLAKEAVVWPVPSPHPKRFPIDLKTAMRLAGANNLQIALAIEKIHEVQAQLTVAEVAWLPTLNAGIGYNWHEGRLQDTRGDVLKVSRSSVFLGGGGAVAGNLPIAGGGNGPLRFAVDFSLTESIFEPLAKQQLVRAAHAAKHAEFNDTLLRVVLAYLDLSQAHGEIVIASEALHNAEELLKLIHSRAKAGSALPVDELRAKAHRDRRLRQMVFAKEKVVFASTELVRLLVLPPCVILVPLETHAVPLRLIPAHVHLDHLIATAVANRPELEEKRALICATGFNVEKEHWRPWIPNVHLGMSTGVFGGGPAHSFANVGTRYDFDAQLVWQIKNLGIANKALTREQLSRNQQAKIQAHQTREQIAKEVALAYHLAHLRDKQIPAALTRVQAAAEAIPLNFDGIRGEQLRAIEAQQAITMLAEARTEQLRLIVDFNRSQFLLLRALGKAMVLPGHAPHQSMGPDSHVGPQPTPAPPATTPGAQDDRPPPLPPQQDGAVQFQNEILVPPIPGHHHSE